MKISIITVVLNAHNDLERTIQSIRKQTYIDFQFVVVDGESTDGTLELLKQNADIVDKLISEKDKGLYYAMNKGRELADGDFAIFMNAGDLFTSNHVLQEVADRLLNLDHLYYGNVQLYSNGIKGRAPLYHHQSIFYPFSFYKNTKYNSDKYLYVAEADFTRMALAFSTSEYFNIDIINSRLDGFAISCYKTWSGTRIYYQESIELLRVIKGKVSVLDRIKKNVIHGAKYVLFKIGGMQLLSKIVIWHGRRNKSPILKVIEK